MTYRFRPASPRIAPLRRSIMAMALAAWLPLALPIGARAQETAAVAATPSAGVATGLADLSRKAWDLAARGEVETIWLQIKQLPPDQAYPAVQALRDEVATYERLDAERRARTRADFDKKVAEMRERMDQGQIRKAISSAVEASGLAEDPQAFLAELKVKELTDQAERDAAKAEADGQWTKALGLYRGLELLYENQHRYNESLKRVGRRVILLRVYAPEVLFEQYKAEAIELGEEAPEPFNAEDDQWHVQLEGIQMRMLHECLHLGQQQHVERTEGYDKLLLGGIDALKVMIETRGLEKTFPSLADGGKVDRFAALLDKVTAEVRARKEPLGYLESARYVNSIQSANDETVKLPEAVLIHELGDGMMSTLDDFSNIVWPHDRAKFDRTISGKFSGVGIQITLVNRQLTVVTPLSDTPAHAAGLKPGDRIVTINGKSTIGMELDTAVDMITGEEGTRVTLGVKGAADDAQSRDVTLTRKEIKIYSVKGWERGQGGSWDYYIDPANRIGYIRMTSFGPTTAEELDAAVNQMRRAPAVEALAAAGVAPDRVQAIASMSEDESVKAMTQEGLAPLEAQRIAAMIEHGDGVRGLILDLRFNPGGLLKAAEEVSNRFLDRGVIVSTTQLLPNGQPWAVFADRQFTYPDFPVVVLINKGSASASEIVAGALQDHHRALIVGERSFGKGSVQNLFRIGGGAGFLKLTTQYYKIPSGRIIHRRDGEARWGIDPDVVVKMTDRQVADSIEARTLLDILREDGEGNVDPKAVLNSRNPKKGEVDKTDGAEAGDAPDAEAVKVEAASDLLTRGLDPQLETALLLLKTRLLGAAQPVAQLQP